MIKKLMDLVKELHKKRKAVNTPDKINNPTITNDIPTQNEHSVVTPESSISRNELWLKIYKFAQKTQKEFEILHESIFRLKEVDKLQTKNFHTLQEDYTKLIRVSETTNRKLKQVLEEQNNSKRNMRCINQRMEDLDQEMNKLLNVFQKIYPQKQGNVTSRIHSQYQQEGINPNSQIENKKRSPSQY
ncbi:hypothetical protein O181_010533 [Austropuccinia psidii MF-1]|uniref:Uncharacterized protein n=1 Tax=Austropuccinia psidii MF-1 TaxID=1389203 RepID=A0A9Q3BTI5_9BASI|nr:hypothetical protein [Austropuccinia psidii MF-1]